MPLSASNLHVGDVHDEQVCYDLSRTQIVQYAGASGDYNPLHTDEPAAQHRGFPSVFAHGMLTMGMTGKMLTNWVGDGRLSRFGARFVNQVWPGDTLTAHATVREVREHDGQKLVELDLETTNEAGTVVLTGYATAQVD
ncbi:MAG: acyl dehydratase [Dehalococcoidia bacterium]|nr:MAG: acyl dehydratase [Dehalococcoidia bacterium]